MILDILSVVYLGISCMTFGRFAELKNGLGMVACGISTVLALIILVIRIDRTMNKKGSK